MVAIEMICHRFTAGYRYLVDYWHWLNNSGHSSVVIEEDVSDLYGYGYQHGGCQEED